MRREPSFLWEETPGDQISVECDLFRSRLETRRRTEHADAKRGRRIYRGER